MVINSMCEVHCNEGIDTGANRAWSLTLCEVHCNEGIDTGANRAWSLTLCVKFTAMKE